MAWERQEKSLGVALKRDTRTIGRSGGRGSSWMVQGRGADLSGPKVMSPPGYT